ncbi:hypothetical protein POTOM_021526 [Populus tomentosa]|uniref:ZC3H15/TMA46 family C-terminal domain-containing protein n=1 Tax=Populus tomentosa TaxID=118781 RepID=A0A8X8A450_POPTO|nr:hypothetical protein POTOM_021526 [Populus tomentosa]
MGGAEEEKQANEMPRSNPITQAQFLLWKRQKAICEINTVLLSGNALLYLVPNFIYHPDSSARKAEAARKREEDIAAGTVQMNGRELFLHEPWVFDNTQY